MLKKTYALQKKRIIKKSGMKKKAEMRKENAGTYKGLIAQELEKVFPEWVDKDKDGYKTINTEELPFVLIEAVKELKQEKDAQVQEQQSRINKLEQQLEALSQRLDAIK